LRKIREIDKKVGVVMITAVKDDDIGKKCIELGAYDYITKPLDLEYLETVLLLKLLAFC
jgi:response regulator of citrate/malate metabolism